MFTPRAHRIQRLGPIVALLSLIINSETPTHSLAVGYTYTTIVDNSGALEPNFEALGQRKINDSGEVSFLASPSFASYNVLKGSGGNTTQIADNSFWGLNQVGNGAVENSGYVVFKGGTTGLNPGIHRGNGVTTTFLLPGNETQDNVDGNKLQVNLISVSNSGLIAYQATTKSCNNSVCTDPVHGYYSLINGSVTPLAHTGAAWSNVGGYAPVINDSGQAAFVMRSVGNNLFHLVFHNGASAASVKAEFIGGKGYWLNNAGQLAYAEAPAVKVITGGVTTTVASTADGFDALMKVGTGEVFINDSGNVAFWGSVSEFQSQPVNWDGVYTGPDIVNDRVLVYGDTVLGHTVGNIDLLGMNNSGQILMGVTAQGANPWHGLVVATPDRPGDFNLDNSVDAADYVAWRKDGLTPQDYQTWQANFGNTYRSGAGISPAAIPEPASLVLFIIAAAGALEARRGART
jgi:hypothetical protein